MENTTLQKTTSPNPARLELVRANAEAFSNDEPIIILDSEECKGDVDTLAILCIELMSFLHANIGSSLTQKILSDSRGQR